MKSDLGRTSLASKATHDAELRDKIANARSPHPSRQRQRRGDRRASQLGGEGKGEVRHSVMSIRCSDVFRRDEMFWGNDRLEDALVLARSRHPAGSTFSVADGEFAGTLRISA